MPAEEFGLAFGKALDDPQVSMAYGRLNVERKSFFEEALMITYRATEDQSDLPEAAGSGWMSKVAGRVYRAQLGNERTRAQISCTNTSWVLIAFLNSWKSAAR
jgi:hypothetical protein